MSPWELEDQATTSTPEPETALVYQQQAGRSLAPIACWMGYLAGQRPRSIPLWSVRGLGSHHPIDLLRLTLSILCVLSLSLFSPLFFPFTPFQSTALCTSIDAALARLSSSDFTGDPGHGLNETGLKLVVVHFLLAHPGTPSLFTLLPCPPGHISHLCGMARQSQSRLCHQHHFGDACCRAAPG